MASAVALDPTFAVAHAGLALLGHEMCARVDVDARLSDARLHARRGTERERSHVHAVAAHVRGDSAPLVAHLEAYPADALLLSVAVPTIAFAGVTEVPEEAWRIVERAAPAYGNDWWYAGLLAFVRQEQLRFDEAMDLACTSLAEEPSAGHSAHARAHAHYETGDHHGGLAWMDGWVTGDGAATDGLTHFAWHAALHELSLGDLDAVRRRYEAQLRPELGTGCRTLVDTGSLLFRWALTPGAVDVPDLAQVIRVTDTQSLERPGTPFLAMHAAVALLAVEDVAGLGRLAAWAGRTPASHPPRGGRAARSRAGGDGLRAALGGGRRAATISRPAGSGARTRSARSSRRPGSRRWSAPAASTRHGSCSTAGWTGGTRRGTEDWRDGLGVAGQARMIWSPSTVMATSSSGEAAGPPSGEPSSIENRLPWQGQLMWPSDTDSTWQPWWVQVVPNALNSPSLGWVITTCSSAKIVPPPTSMSEVEARPLPPPPPEELSAWLGVVPPSDDDVPGPGRWRCPGRRRCRRRGAGG